MSENKKIAVQKLTDEELAQVVGGDNGDCDKEKAKTVKEMKPLYQVGQIVEIYNTVLHISTYTAEILSYTPYLDLYGYYIPKYTVKNVKNGDVEQVLSNHIQSS